MNRPPDDRDAAQDIAREPAEITAHLATLKGEAFRRIERGRPRSRVPLLPVS